MGKFVKSIYLFFLLIICVFSAKAYSNQFSEEKQNLILRWKKETITVAFSNSLIKASSAIKPNSDVLGAVRRSLETWENASNIRFIETQSDKQNISPSGSFGDGISLITIAQTPENLLLFSKDWEEVSARTRIFFNKKGEITEADIVLNPYQQFSTDGSIGTFDLESTITHELGHFLGLEHSSVLSATMHESNGKNGLFDLQSFNSRTLSETDISAIRALYGTNDKEVCCGKITGKLSFSNGRAAESLQVWAENADTGKVVAERLTNGDGVFTFEGLEEAVYKIYSQGIQTNALNFSSEYVGETIVKNEKTQTINKTIKQSNSSLGLQYIGFNGQLAQLAVTLNKGNSYIVFLGGKNFQTENIEVGFNSPYLTEVPESRTVYDYGEGIKVISFEIKVGSNIPFGSYSVFAKSKSGKKEYLVGGITIEDYLNPWYSRILPSN